MDIALLPSETGTPLAVFSHGPERIRLTFRHWQGNPIFRIERWHLKEGTEPWIFNAFDGLSLTRDQAECLQTGIQKGLLLIDLSINKPSPLGGS